MLDEFKIGLLRGQSPSVIFTDLKAKLDNEMYSRLHEMERSKEAADMISQALRQPDGEARDIAIAYLRQYEADTGIKMKRDKNAEGSKEE